MLQLLFNLRGKYLKRLRRVIYTTNLPNGIVLLQPSDSIGINREIFSDKTYTKHRDIHEDDIIIDIGAHVGIFTSMASKKAKNGKVIAIEPNLFNYNLLLKNIKINKLKNVIPINEALSNFSGVTKMYVSQISSQFSTISPKNLSEKMRIQRSYDKYELVNAITLDKLLEKIGIKKVNFIKIDAEGAEIDILKGAEKTLRINDDIFLSIAAEHHEDEVNLISKYLISYGFNCMTFFYKPQSSWHVYAFKTKN